jgi:hypothetical protein
MLQVDEDDLRRLRARARAARTDLTRAAVTHPGQPALLGMATAHSQPAVGQFFSSNPVDVGGEEVEGGPATTTVATYDNILVYLHGVEGDPRLVGPVAPGDLLTADFVDYRWATWRFPPPNPRFCFHCVWPTAAPWPALSLGDPYQAAPVPLATTDGVHYTGCGLSSDEPANTEIGLTPNGTGPFTITLSNAATGTHSFGPYASVTATALQLALEAVYGTGNVFVGSNSGDLSGTPTVIQFVGGMRYENLSVTCSGYLSCFRLTADPGPIPIYYELDLSNCTLTVTGIVTGEFGQQGCVPATGYTCADLPNPGANLNAGDNVASFQFAVTRSTCTPLAISFDASKGTINGNGVCFAGFYGIDAYRPYPVYTIGGPDLPGPFAWARCLGTRQGLSTTFTLTDPYGTGAVTMSYGSWALPVVGLNQDLTGWWGCGTIVVPDQCAGTGTITVPVAYFLDQRSCGFSLYYLAAAVNGFGVPTDGCGNSLAPRSGTCAGGDGPGQGYGIGAGQATVVPIIGPLKASARTPGPGATWIEVDSYNPLHITATIDPVGARALYGVPGPLLLTMTAAGA